MTDNYRELIEEARRLAEWHLGWSADSTSYETNESYEFRALADALESLLAELETVESFLSSYKRATARAEAERDAMAAQISETKTAWLAGRSWEGRSIGDILSADPAAVLREHDARIRSEVIDSFRESLYQSSPLGDFAWIIEAARDHFGITEEGIPDDHS